MILGCYVLQLYCDSNKGHRINKNNYEEYTGETRSEAEEVARAEGWKLYETNDKAICPICNKEEQA